MQLRIVLIAAITGLLAACGGGSGNSGSGNGGPQADSGDRVSLTASGATTPVPSATNADLDFVVANPGTGAANDVVLTVTLGAGLRRAGVECSASGGAVCPSDPNALRVATLPAGGRVRFRMSVIPSAGASGAIVTTAAVTASNDQVASNNSAQVSITAYSADVSVTGSSDASELFSGRSVPYSLTVSNAGPDAAQDVVLENTLSSGQTMIAMTCSASGGATCPAAPGEQMTIPSLPSGGSLTFAVTAQLAMDVVVSVSDTLRATLLGDGDIANNAATVSATTRIPTSQDSPSFVVLQSDVGDYIGDPLRRGANYSYTRANAVFEMNALDGMLTVTVTGDQRWRGIFYMPANITQLQAGRYVDLRGAPFHDLSSPGLDWGGEGRGCEHTGWFQIDEVVYAAGELASIDLRFEQHCNGLAPAIRGQIHWVAGDETRPPGPVNPPPVGLWAPAADATPASGNYVYIESDPGDFVGQGRTETFTQANAVLTVSESAGLLTVSTIGDRSYLGEFNVMTPLTRMEPGYYANAQRWPFGNPTFGRFQFGGGCNVLSGWFVVDSITFADGVVTALDLRFEQHCENAAPALRGRIHWRSDDPAQPPGPQQPPPEGLWAPPAGATPPMGNVVYLQSDAGDFIGRGLTKAYTPLDSVIEVGGGGLDPVGNRFQLTVRAEEEWTGYFQAMNTLQDLQPGYYGNLLDFPFHNPAVGGLDWSGEGRGCNDLSGWFVIDSVTYSGAELDSIELRFEQHCEFSSAALRGMIRWSSADTRQPPPPQNPPPADLWDAPAGAAGNYVYLQSDAGDYIGQGETYLYTAGDSDFDVRTSGSQLDVEVHSGDVFWSGYFIPMSSLSQLQVGYYGGLTSANIAKGDLRWGGDGRGCGQATGWFAVDGIAFTGGAVTSIDLRFEHRCSPEAAALHGKIHWRVDNPP